MNQKNMVQHNSTKHVELDYHFIKKKDEVGMIKFSFVRFENQLVNILIKTVDSNEFLRDTWLVKY